MSLDSTQAHSFRVGAGLSFSMASNLSTESTTLARNSVSIQRAFVMLPLTRKSCPHEAREIPVSEAISASFSGYFLAFGLAWNKIIFDESIHILDCFLVIVTEAEYTFAGMGCEVSA